MSITRRRILSVPPALLAAGAVPLGALPAAAAGAGAVNVVFAGSMGVVMDKGIGPAFEARTGIKFYGIGQAAMALAELLAAKSLTADVFVSVSAGPVKVVEKAGLIGHAAPVASTDFVLAYSPASKFAAAFASAGTAGWPQVLATPGLRYGRTDPTVDPQGAYNLYCLQLAELYYKLPGFADKVAGPMLNPAQIFAEPSLLARLQEGQIDATLGYESAVVSQRLPYIKLPPEINFSSPALAKTWYAKATLTLKGKPAHPSPLVFYAAALANAPDPGAARAFAAFLSTPEAQGIFAHYGYNPGKGKSV